jgi:hypothetical protein
VALLFALVLAGACAARVDPSDPPDPSDSPSPEVTLSNLRYTCDGRHTFGPEMFALPALAELDPHPSGVALRAFLADPEPGWGFLAEHYWLAGRDETSAGYVAAWDGDPAFVYLALDDRATGWEVSGGGDCRPTLVIPDLGPATWQLDPEEGRPGPDATSFSALVTERSCASGQSSEDRVSPPMFSYGRDQVLVAFGVRPLGGMQNCPGNPETRVAVVLREPLGERELLDAGLFPPRDPTQPWP